MTIFHDRPDVKKWVTSMLRTRSQVRVLVVASAAVAQLAEHVRHLLRSVLGPNTTTAMRSDGATSLGMNASSHSGSRGSSHRADAKGRVTSSGDGFESRSGFGRYAVWHGTDSARSVLGATTYQPEAA